MKLPRMLPHWAIGVLGFGIHVDCSGQQLPPKVRSQHDLRIPNGLTPQSLGGFGAQFRGPVEHLSLVLCSPEGQSTVRLWHSNPVVAWQGNILPEADNFASDSHESAGADFEAPLRNEGLQGSGHAVDSVAVQDIGLGRFQLLLLGLEALNLKGLGLRASKPMTEGKRLRELQQVLGNSGSSFWSVV